MEPKFEKNKILPALVAFVALVVCTVVELTNNNTSTRFLILFSASLASALGLMVYLILSLWRVQKHISLFTADIDKFNRKYIFDRGQKKNLAELRADLLLNLEKAIAFSQQIIQGNYSVEWTLPNVQSSDHSLLARRFSELRDTLQSIKERDEKRIWFTDGLTKFSGIARESQQDLQQLSDNVIQFLTKHLDAQQGGLFTVAEENNTTYLELAACYAFNRKRFLEKKIRIGDGLVGQAYLEGTVILTDLPPNYTFITSGLGDATPRNLIVVPMKHNGAVAAVVEFASFQKFDPQEIEFLEKAGDILASSIFHIRTSASTTKLLGESQQHAETLKLQEEELKQNLEELETTQEQMKRNVDELNKLKLDLEKERYLFTSLMNNLPNSIYFKDKNSTLIRVSQHMCKHFGQSEEELIGKSDFDFQDAEHAQQAFDDEMHIMTTRIPKIDFVEKETRNDGTEVWISSTKMPLIDFHDQVVGTFGISRDITEQIKLKEELRALSLELEQMKAAEMKPH